LSGDVAGTTGNILRPERGPDTGADRVSEDISVVIPTVGREILKKCLASIAAGHLLPHSLVVVDQSATDEIRDWLEPLSGLGVRVHYLPSNQTGRAAGVNRGIECVTTAYFAITDDDCLVAPDWLLNLRKQLERDPGAAITGRVEAGDEQTVGIVVTSMQPARYEKPRLKFDALCGGNMATSTTVIRRTGLLDEDIVLRCSEDGEWAYRALRAGVPIIYAPDAVVRHIGWRDPGERGEQYRAYARSHGAFYGKYLRRGDGFIALRAMAHHARALRRLVRGILGGNAEDVLIARAYLAGLIPGAIAGFRSQAGIVKGAQQHDRQK
jgi:GT2 family glycosyltransferase